MNRQCGSGMIPARQLAREVESQYPACAFFSIAALDPIDVMTQADRLLSHGGLSGNDFEMAKPPDQGKVAAIPKVGRLRDQYTRKA